MLGNPFDFWYFFLSGDSSENNKLLTTMETICFIV